jgi:diacylglycerol kinase family enzyme
MVRATTLTSDKTPRIGVLINPLSGKNRKESAAIMLTLGENPDILQHTVQGPRDVYNALFDFSRQKVNTVVISGGDGTIQAVLTVLFHNHPFTSLPQLIVLEGGTTNMIAGDIGIKGNQSKALHRLFKWLETGSGNVTRQQRSILRLQVPGHEAKYGMFFGAAGISQGIQYYRKHLHHKKLHGLPGICMTVLRYLWALTRRQSQIAPPTAMQVSTDNQRLQGEYFMLLFVSTLDHLFFGLRPFWGNEDGRLRLTAVRSKARNLLWVLPIAARGRKAEKATPENGYYSHNADEIELHIADSMALDGEIYTPDSSRQPTLLQYGGKVIFVQL